MRGPSERCCAPSPPSLGSRDRISPLSQRLATATRLEVRAQKKAAKQAPRAAGDENADPQLRPGRAGARPPQAPSSVPGPTETCSWAPILSQPERVPEAPPPTKRPWAPVNRNPVRFRSESLRPSAHRRFFETSRACCILLYTMIIYPPTEISSRAPARRRVRSRASGRR